jgi:hypothetical protein
MRKHGLPLFLSALAASCFLSSRDEVARVTSPSGRLDAVLVETNGGATTSFGYQAYVVPRGSKNSRGPQVAFLYGAVRSTHAWGANLKWEGPSRLVIEYLEAKEERLSRPLVVVDADTVRVSLRSGVLDATAPAGGMVYNLEKGRR